ncbi:MAG TPA: cyclopropane-fatty-acyl-phospholipid synthase family protein [Gemmatimonadaceae bacterium]|nr:cyclopropane-fatty-acyl-phospholipid synthase family protein [Gemmatimonadaceae bacterium]
MPTPHPYESGDTPAIVRDSPRRAGPGEPYHRAPTPGPSSTADAALYHARQVIALLFGPPSVRRFDVRYWDGMVERASTADTPYLLAVNDAGALRRMLLPPSELAIVETFLAGGIDVEGDLEAAVTLGDAIAVRVRSPRTLARLARHLLALPSSAAVRRVRAARAERVVAPVGRQHEPARDRAAVRYHYDVGNDFYALWLDRRMVYSCAYFPTPTTSLDEAQLAKLDLVCRKLRLRPGERFLDVGCGWGALVLHAAQRYGVTALGITLSEAQAALARERIAAAGLADRCRVEIRDYRDLPAGVAFDKIASVGMVEHVGVDHLPTYFGALYRALAPGGLLLNHGIVSVAAARPRCWRARVEARLWRRDAFIDQYVFPDGRLGPLHAVIAAAEGAGFETRDAESLREHYVMTLRAWVSRLARQRERAVALADARTYRTWRLYMAGSAHGFASGRLNVVQTLLAKPDAAGRAGLPLTRRDLLGEGHGQAARDE